jgi:hypothetical protein
MVRITQILGVLFILLYAGDWIVLRARVAHGDAFRTIQVHQFLTTPLKGRKEEYDYNGDVDMTCSRSIFYQAGNPPCWWLARHTTQWE